MSVGYSRRTSVRSSRSAATRAAMQLLQLGLDAVLLEAGVVAELERRVVQHLVQLDRAASRPSGSVGDEHPVALADRARRVHPVERLVGLGVGVHRDRAVGLQDQEAQRRREPGPEASLVLDRAAGDEQTHRRVVARVRIRAGPLARLYDAARPSLEEVAIVLLAVNTNSDVYNVVLVLHILCAIIGFGHGVPERDLRQRGEVAPRADGLAIVRGELQGLEDRRVLHLRRVRLRPRARRHERPRNGSSRGQTWIWLAIVLYIIALGISHGVLFPAVKRMRRADGRGDRGRPAGRRAAAAGRGDGSSSASASPRSAPRSTCW